jgi:PAS domain S-box-containing protein
MPAHPSKKPVKRPRREPQTTPEATESAASAKLPLSSKRLIHELQVHQVELQLQNEELKRSQAQIEAGLERYTAIYDSAPVGYFTLTRDGVISHANLTGAEMLGMSRSQLPGRAIAAFIPPALHPQFQGFVHHVFTSSTRISEDFLLLGDAPLPRHVNIKGQRIGSKKECQIVVSDITARKGAELNLLRSKTMLSSLIAQAPIGIFVVGPCFKLEQVNPRAMSLFRRAHPLIGRDFAEVLHEVWPGAASVPSIESVLAQFRHTLETGASYQSPELAERRGEDRVKEIYEWQVERITFPDNEYGVVCFFKDITPRIRAQIAKRRLAQVTASNTGLKEEIARRIIAEKGLILSEHRAQMLLEESQRLQEKLRQLSHGIIRMQETQRGETSHELHDGISQLLVGIGVHLTALTKKADLDPKNLQESLAPVHRLVAQSVQVLHGLARRLRPAMLDELGLIPTLRTYIDSLPKRQGLQIAFTATVNLDHLNTDQRTVLFRVTQEALVNVSKHAQASRVRITLAQVRRGVSLEIADNGQAFDVTQLEHLASEKRLGLSSMRERLNMIGGSFKIKSVAGVGTTIRVVVPLAEVQV